MKQQFEATRKYSPRAAVILSVLGIAMTTGCGGGDGSATDDATPGVTNEAFSGASCFSATPDVPSNSPDPSGAWALVTSSPMTYDNPRCYKSWVVWWTDFGFFSFDIWYTASLAHLNATLTQPARGFIPPPNNADDCAATMIGLQAYTDRGTNGASWVDLGTSTAYGTWQNGACTLPSLNYFLPKHHTGGWQYRYNATGRGPSGNTRPVTIQADWYSDTPGLTGTPGR
jgi:hypothetical protein